MSLINDALTRAKQVQPAQPPPLPMRPVEPARQPADSMGWIVWAAIGTFVLFVAAGASVVILQIKLKDRAPTAKTPSVSDVTPVHAKAPPAESIPGPSQPEPKAAAIVEGTVTAPPSEPAPPKLQAIIFHPTRPSAMVGGKTLFVGERVGEWKIVGITATQVILAGGGETNVLTLE